MYLDTLATSILSTADSLHLHKQTVLLDVEAINLPGEVKRATKPISSIDNITSCTKWHVFLYGDVHFELQR